MTTRQMLRHDTKMNVWLCVRALSLLESGRIDEARKELASAAERAEHVRSVVWARGSLEA